MYFALKNLQKKIKKQVNNSQPAKCKVGMIIFEWLQERRKEDVLEIFIVKTATRQVWFMHFQVKMPGNGRENIFREKKNNKEGAGDRFKC